MLNSLHRLGSLLTRFLKLERSIDDIKINQGILLAEMGDRVKSSTLCHHEFKIFSQWGEDGILQFLTRNLNISHRTFIEFGVEDFFESNCRLLLMKDGWQGFVIDGSHANIDRLSSSYFYWRYPLQAISAFVTRENVSDLLEKSGFDKQCGVLSVDVDGVDWHLLRQLGHWNASIVVVEYNSVFGSRHSITVPYRSDFVRSRSHWSNLYWGASLPAFDLLLSERGYSLVGVNSAGSNAFFVRSDLINDRIRPTSVADCFLESRFRESRSSSGSLLFRTAQHSRDLIAHLPVLDTVTQRSYSLGQLFEAEFSQ